VKGHLKETRLRYFSKYFDSHNLLFVDVVISDGSLGSLEAKADVLVVPHALLGLLSQRLLAGDEHRILLLVSLLGLHNTKQY
jgi:hypothetical protein